MNGGLFSRLGGTDILRLRNGLRSSIWFSRLGDTGNLHLWWGSRRSLGGEGDEAVGHLVNRWTVKGAGRGMPGQGKASCVARKTFPMGRYLLARNVRGHQHTHSKGFLMGRYCDHVSRIAKEGVVGIFRTW